MHSKLTNGRIEVGIAAGGGFIRRPRLSRNPPVLLFLLPLIWTGRHHARSSHHASRHQRLLLLLFVVGAHQSRGGKASRTQYREFFPHVMSQAYGRGPILSQLQTVQYDVARHGLISGRRTRLYAHRHLVPLPSAGVRVFAKHAPSSRGKFHLAPLYGNADDLPPRCLAGAGRPPVLVGFVVLRSREKDVPPRQLGIALRKDEASVVLFVVVVSRPHARSGRLAVHDDAVGGRVGHVGIIHDAVDVGVIFEGADVLAVLPFVVVAAAASSRDGDAG
mmetsp:Transcript_20347/g.42700  ORF Transcript_20347/g.42700 Transcript_20347/m.42700 type:complete len:276 (-) Transcript_20347:136-963(-)